MPRARFLPTPFGRRTRWVALALVVVLVIGALLVWQWRRRLGTFDIIVYNGRIFDGVRMLTRGLCVGIRGGKIAKIGFLYPAHAKQWLNAHGQVVAPGFIDVHTHVERNIPKNRPFRAPNFVRQGVTTLITGNCGTSSVDIEGLLDGLAKYGSQVNVATLVGHNSVREAVMGRSTEAASAEAIEKMRKLVDRNMAAGALGFSSGLAYSPGCFATRDEVVKLAQVAGRYSGLYVTHMRDEAIEGPQALEEAIQIARLAHVPLHISHFKIAAERQWGSAASRLQRLDRERKAGLPITLDVYGYRASSSSLEILLPTDLRGDNVGWRALGDTGRRAVIGNQILARLREAGFPDFSYAKVAVFGPNREVEGKDIPELAVSLGYGEASQSNVSLKSQVDAILYLLSHGGAQMVYTDMKEDDVETILKDSHTSIGTDSAVRGGGAFFVHPRGVGNFPRILGHYVRELQVLTLEEALRKMTSLAAETFHLGRRGRIQQGYAADLVVFDPSQIADNATYAAPLNPPSGITFVLVNGVLAVDQGRTTGKNAGRPIRRMN